MPEITTFITNHSLLALAVLFVFLLTVFIELLRAKRNICNISPAKVTQLINHENAVVLDIRQNDAFRTGHIIDAQSINGQEMLQNPKKLEKYRARPIIVVANASSESQKIASQLLKQGYNAYSLSGGIRAWSEAQMPLVKE